MNARIWMDYNESVSLIDSIQSKDTEVRTVVADIYDLGDEISIKEYLGVESVELVSGIEKQPEAAKAPEEAAKPVVQRQKETAVRRMPNVLNKITEKKKEVARELEEMIKAQTKAKVPEPEKVKGAPAPQKEALVLPGLSLQDQVRELEKIELGLDQGVFEGIQLEIIKREVAGLKEAAGNIVPADDFQKNLVQIRNSRLSEVSKRLGV